MSWTIDWGPAVQRDLLTLRWSAAARACRAVMTFAETGRGSEQHQDNPLRRRLRMPGAVVYVLLDPVDRVVHVLRVFQRP